MVTTQKCRFKGATGKFLSSKPDPETNSKGVVNYKEAGVLPKSRFATISCM